MDGKQEAILAYARSLAGDEADAMLLTGMCAAAARELTGRLRAGVSPDELGETFVSAAGILALAMYCGIRDAGQLVKSFKAGELSVTYADGEASPEALRKTAEMMLSAYLEDQGFGFLGVPG